MTTPTEQEAAYIAWMNRLAETPNSMAAFLAGWEAARASQVAAPPAQVQKSECEACNGEGYACGSPEICEVCKGSGTAPRARPVSQEPVDNKVCRFPDGCPDAWKCSSQKTADCGATCKSVAAPQPAEQTELSDADIERIYEEQYRAWFDKRGLTFFVDFARAILAAAKENKS